MARFYTVKIGTLYLTDDGTLSGTPCKFPQIAGLDGLDSDYNTAIVLAADNTPHVFATENDGRGVSLRFPPTTITADVRDSLKTIFNAAILAVTTINVLIEGEPGNYDLECVPGSPQAPKPIEFTGKFVGDRLYEVFINLTVVSKN